MHVVSLLAEVYASSATQDEAALQELSARAHCVRACYCTDMSDTYLPPILKPARWQDRRHNLCQVKLAVTEGHQGRVGKLSWGFWSTWGID